MIILIIIGSLLLTLIEGHSASVRGVAWSHDSSKLLSCSDDCSSVLWSLESSDPLMILHLTDNNFGADRQGGLKATAVGVFPTFQ